MLLKTKREWKIVYDLLLERFRSVGTDEQMDEFKAMCERKFSSGVILLPNTLEDYETAVSLILEYVYNNDMVLV